MQQLVADGRKALVVGQPEDVDEEREALDSACAGVGAPLCHRLLAEGLLGLALHGDGDQAAVRAPRKHEEIGL